MKYMTINVKDKKQKMTIDNTKNNTTIDNTKKRWQRITKKSYNREREKNPCSYIMSC
jgi:hypothetical protein